MNAGRALAIAFGLLLCAGNAAAQDSIDPQKKAAIRAGVTRNWKVTWLNEDQLSVEALYPLNAR